MKKILHAVGRHRVNQRCDHAEHHGAQHAADGTLHGLFGADHRAQLMLAEGAACKISAGVAAPGKAQDEQDEEHGIIAVLFHRQALFEQDKGVETEDHDAREHQQAAGLLVADGAVAHHQIDGIESHQHKRHRHDQPPHDAVVGKHDQQRVVHHGRIHEPVLLFKAEGIVNFVDGDQGDGRDDQIEDHGVKGEHHADQDDDAHDCSNNTSFHRFCSPLLCRRAAPLSVSRSPRNSRAFRSLRRAQE